MSTVKDREKKLAPSEEQSAVSPHVVSHEMIAEKAYDLFVLSHCVTGQELDHWLEAEKLLREGKGN
jgi:hypothetical protein